MCDLVKKSRGGGVFLPLRGGSQGGHVSSFETGGGHWHGGSMGIDAFPWGGLATGRRGGHAQVSRQAKHYAHRGINALMSCDKAY